MQIIAVNKKANYDFLIEEKFDAGLVLTGSEVKSLRVNTGSIKESYVSPRRGVVWPPVHQSINSACSTLANLQWKNSCLVDQGCPWEISKAFD